MAWFKKGLGCGCVSVLCLSGLVALVLWKAHGVSDRARRVHERMHVGMSAADAFAKAVAEDPDVVIWAILCNDKASRLSYWGWTDHQKLSFEPAQAGGAAPPPVTFRNPVELRTQLAKAPFCASLHFRFMSSSPFAMSRLFFNLELGEDGNVKSIERIRHSD